MEKTHSLFIMLMLIAALCFAGAASAAQKELPKKVPGSQPVVLEADSVTFDEKAHTVVAEGHAVVNYLDMVLNADRITMDSQKNIVRAYAVEGKRIRVWRSAWNPLILKQETQTLAGTFLEYHIDDATGYIETGEGTATAEMGMIYINGGKLEVAPPAIAYERKWVHGRDIKKSLPEDSIIRWDKVSYTTCRQDDQHYHFVSKKAVLIPGKHMTLYRPRVYAGKRFLFTIPFNVSINQGPRKKNRISLRPNYDDDKKLGMQAVYVHSWKNGKATLGVAKWTKGITEYDYRIDQKLTDWLAVYVDGKYHYDDVLRETKIRPTWGVTAAHSGWTARVSWAERQKHSIVRRPGEKEYETTIWRKPQVQLTTPWVGLHIGDVSQYVRLKGDWGRYQDTGRQRQGYFIERYGWGIDYYIDYPFRVGKWSLSPFFKVDYWNYGYEDKRHNRFEITTATTGLRASCGVFEIGSAYEHRRVFGRSGCGWDSVSDADTFYQRVGVKIGPSLRFSVQGMWDLSKTTHDKFTNISYILTYDNSCCTRWELTFHDDKRHVDNNNWFTLSFAINAFPDSRFKWGNHSVENPFGRPGGLVPKRKPGYQATLMEIDGTLQAEQSEIRVPIFDI